MSTEKDRKEFIDWLADEHGLESEWQEERNCFKDFPAHLAFQAWQASRAALVIDLYHEDEEKLCSFDHGIGYRKAKNIARQSIRAAGLKVTP